MLPEFLIDRRITGFLSFFSFFFAILTLFVLLSHFIPLARGIGWFWLIFFLFLFFIGEPFYRRFTDNFAHHILVLEFYLFSVYFMQHFFASSPYAHLFYLIPIFSAALSFGLMGTMLTSSFAFLLEVVRVSPPWQFTPAAIPPLLPDILPLFILALLLGFTVELKNHTQQQLLHRLSKMDAFQALKEVVDSTGKGLPFTEELIKTVVEITKVQGGVILQSEPREVVASAEIQEAELQALMEVCSEGEQYYRHRRVYRISLPWEETAYELVLWGSRLQGILLQAEAEMIRALAVYLEHFIDHLRVQHEKEKSYRLQEALIEAVPLGIVVTDARGAILEMNRRAGELLSLTPTSAVGRRAREVFDFKEKEFELSPTRAEVDIVSEKKIIPADFSIRAADLRRGEEQWVIVFSDLSPLKELQEKAERRRRLLALGEFAAGMAHEIRNPLGSLSGFLSLLKKKINSLEPGEELEKLLQKIQASYNRIDQLVENFLLYARKPEPELEKFNLKNFLQPLIDEFELPSNIEFDYDISAADCLISANQPRLETALLNVLRNARQAVNESGRLEFKVTYTGDRVKFIVADNGPGISPEKIDKVFDPFYSEKDEGLGLGLAIVHRIITEELDGDVFIDSEIEKGTEITLTIPKNNSTQMNAD